MSRIGNQPIIMPENVHFNLSGSLMQVEGPLGKLEEKLPNAISVKQAGQTLTFARRSNLPQERALHGLTRALVANMVVGVTTGYQKTLELVGTGYRVTAVGTGINLNLGLSHAVDFAAPESVTITVEGNNKIHLKSINKALLGQTAANIRKVRPPEVYKGKGIRYLGEVVRKKAGKTAKAGAK